jgi:hypothetical protein
MTKAFYFSSIRVTAAARRQDDCRRPTGWQDPMLAAHFDAGQRHIVSCSVAFSRYHERLSRREDPLRIWPALPSNGDAARFAAFRAAAGAALAGTAHARSGPVGRHELR